MHSLQLTDNNYISALLNPLVFSHLVQVRVRPRVVMGDVSLPGVRLCRCAREVIGLFFSIISGTRL